MRCLSMIRSTWCLSHLIVISKLLFHSEYVKPIQHCILYVYCSTPPYPSPLTPPLSSRSSHTYPTPLFFPFSSPPLSPSLPPGVAMEACEFWSALSDDNDAHALLQSHLGTLIPSLISRLQLKEEQILQVTHLIIILCIYCARRMLECTHNFFTADFLSDLVRTWFVRVMINLIVCCCVEVVYVVPYHGSQLLNFKWIASIQDVSSLSPVLCCAVLCCAVLSISLSLQCAHRPSGCNPHVLYLQLCMHCGEIIAAEIDLPRVWETVTVIVTASICTCAWWCVLYIYIWHVYNPYCVSSFLLTTISTITAPWNIHHHHLTFPLPPCNRSV